MSLTAVSLFAGVGGFDLALERAGVDVVAAVEIDKQASGVLAHRFPSTRLLGDVMEVTGDELRSVGLVPERGVLTGGFPCQDLSIAGKRAGLAGARSGLFWQIARLLDELSPRYLILENVPGLLSSNGGRDLGIVLGALAERGYGFAYRVLDAQHFGVPQRRRRVFIVGCLGDDGRAPAQVLALPESLRGDHPTSDAPGSILAADPRSSVALYGQTGFARYTEGQVKILSATDHKRAEDNIVVKRRRAQTVDDFESWDNSSVAPTLNVFDNATETRATVLQVHPRVRRLTPMECERLQGFPDNWTSHRIDPKRGLIEQADSSRYKQMGNAVAVPCVEWIIARLIELEQQEAP